MNIFAKSLSPMQHSATSPRYSQITILNIAKPRHCKRRYCCRQCNFFPSQVSSTNTGTHMASIHSKKIPSWSQPVAVIPSNPKYVLNFKVGNLASALNYAPFFSYSVRQITIFYKLMLNSGIEKKQLLSHCKHHF